ncbi:MAG: prepilin-type N-terminal cleavage/methylation domain-containing protein [Terriglobia bacterium]
MRAKSNGFSLIELLIVVAIILIIAAIAIPNFLRSRMAANQSSAVASCRGIASSELTYLTMYGQGYSSSLTILGPPAGGGVPTPSAADLIDSYLAAGIKSGYSFAYVPTSQDAQGRYQGFMINANPTEPGVTGNAYYYTDQSFVIRENGTTTASASDSPIGG